MLGLRLVLDAEDFGEQSGSVSVRVSVSISVTVGVRVRASIGLW